MKTFFLALLWAFPGYVIGLFGSLWLLPLISSNTHDGQMEAAMTGAFVIGPLLAILAFGSGIVFLRSRKKTPR